MHRRHAQGRAVGRDVARPARRVAVLAHGAGLQAGLDRDLGARLVEDEVGVEAEVPDHGDAGTAHPFEQIRQTPSP